APAESCALAVPGALPIWLGVDEDTAAFISPDNVIEVVGSGSVTVVDGDDLQFSAMAQLDGGNAPVSMLGIQLHILAAGATYDLRSEEHTSELQSRDNLVC